MKNINKNLIHNKIKNTLDNFNVNSVNGITTMFPEFIYKKEFLEIENIDPNKYSKISKIKCCDRHLVYGNPANWIYYKDSNKSILFTNMLPNELPKSKKQQKSYNWVVVLKKGLYEIRYAIVDNFLEIGAKHSAIINSDTLCLAGELSVSWDDIKKKWVYIFNKNSGKLSPKNYHKLKICTENNITIKMVNKKSVHSNDNDKVNMFNKIIMTLINNLFNELIIDGSIVTAENVDNDSENKYGIHLFYKEHPRIYPSNLYIEKLNKWAKKNRIMNACIGYEDEISETSDYIKKDSNGDYKCAWD
jgi:hypothetical protein